MRVQPQTLGWLERYGLRWDLLIMREFGDYMVAPAFKQRSVRELRRARLRPPARVRGRPPQRAHVPHRGRALRVHPLRLLRVNGMRDLSARLSAGWRTRARRGGSLECPRAPQPLRRSTEMMNNVKTAVLLAGLGGLIMAVGAAVGGQSRADHRSGHRAGQSWAAPYWFSDKLAITSAAGPGSHRGPVPPVLRDRARSHPAGRHPDAPAVRRPEPPAQRVRHRPQSRACRGVRQRGPHAVPQLGRDRGRARPRDLSHVRNRDILTSSVAAAIAMGITFAARMAMWGAMFGGGGTGSRRRRHRRPADDLPGTGRGDGVIQMAISRSREFQADASAARCSAPASRWPERSRSSSVGAKQSRSM